MDISVDDLRGFESLWSRRILLEKKTRAEARAFVVVDFD